MPQDHLEDSAQTIIQYGFQQQMATANGSYILFTVCLLC